MVVRLASDFFGDRDVGFDEQLLRGAAFFGVFAGRQLVGGFDRPCFERDGLRRDFAVAERSQAGHLVERLGAVEGREVLAIEHGANFQHGIVIFAEQLASLGAEQLVRSVFRFDVAGFGRRGIGQVGLAGRQINLGKQAVGVREFGFERDRRLQIVDILRVGAVQVLFGPQRERVRVERLNDDVRNGLSARLRPICLRRPA